MKVKKYIREVLSKMGDRKLLLLENFNLFRLYFTGKFRENPEFTINTNESQRDEYMNLYIN